MSQFFGDSIFWIDVDKIKPNPYQPRKEFDEARLRDLADSIGMYGVLQPLVVTRKEVTKEDGGISTEYELISGERRLRASKLAGVREVPAIIRSGTDDSRLKLELAIIENLQREDLNPIDRARAFKQLHEEFKFKHGQIAERVGKSREYVSNTIRLLDLPKEVLAAVEEGRISEGHTRPLLMLGGRPEEQMTLFKEILLKKLTVREVEHIARNIAVERIRRKDRLEDPETYDLEAKLSEVLGTRVRIEHKGEGGRVHIDFFSDQDLRALLQLVDKGGNKKILQWPVLGQKDGTKSEPVKEFFPEKKLSEVVAEVEPQSHPIEKEVVQKIVDEQIAPSVSTSIVNDIKPVLVEDTVKPILENVSESVESTQSVVNEAPIDDRSLDEKKDDEAELYSIKNFSL